MVPSVSVPVPVKFAELPGNVIAISAPAFAAGAILTAAFTVTRTVSFPVAPLLSVTVSSY